MKVEYFLGGYDKNLSYLLWCNKTKHAALIDPAVEISPIIEYISTHDLILNKILITHSHFDHIKYLYDIINHFNNVKIYIHHESKVDIDFISLSHNQIINVGTDIINVLLTPGHYYDSVCFWNQEDRLVFTGDTMFIGRTGRVINPKSNIEDLYDSIYNILLKLPHNTQILPGHHYGYKMFDTISNNIDSSSFFQCDSLKMFKIVMQKYEKNRKK